MSKLATMQDAMSRLTQDLDTVVMEGFTHLIPFAAGHELIRQRRKELALYNMPLTEAIFALLTEKGLLDGKEVKERVAKLKKEDLESF